jgi:ATP-dependent DNA helicase RecG
MMNYTQAPADLIFWMDHNSSIDALAETMVAIANGSGGTIACAVSGDTQPIIDRMTEACFATDPALIIPAPRISRIDDKSGIMLSIPAGLPHVYSYRGRYLVRDGHLNVPLSSAQLRRMILERGELSFETTPVPGATLDDINWDKARDYARSMVNASTQDAQDLLLRRGCLHRSTSQLQPTYAGLLLFGKDPQSRIRNSDMVAVRFPGETMSDAFIRSDISGTLPDQIRAAEVFLSTHLQKEVQLSGSMQHKETYEYPMEAARELVINAVAHRDYSVQGNNIHIQLFSNRMEVHSPGRLPGPMTLANLREARFSRNPAIVQVLSDLHYIERLGYGLDRVIDLMQSRNLQAPEFIERDGGFHVTLRRQQSAPPQLIKAPPVPKPVPAAGLRGTFNGQEINTRQEIAISYLLTSGKYRITNGELQDLLPDAHPETLRRDLADLVSKEILVKLGQKRGSYYMLKKSESAG